MKSGRPCQCNRAVVGQFDDSQCVLCWLFMNRADYRELWGGGISLWGRIRNLHFAIVRLIGNYGKMAGRSERRKRRQLCDQCDLRDKVKDRCSMCGCCLSGVLLNKIKWKSEKCPAGKW